MAEDERDTPILSGSFHSFARSWNRAANFSESTLVSSDQHLISGSFGSRRHSLLISQPVSRRVSKLTLHDDSKPDSLTRLLSSNYGSNYLGDSGDNNNLSRVPSDVTEQRLLSADEYAALTRDLSDSIHELYAARSTFAQTVFNTVNLIFGVGLLGFPLALRHAGFLLGLVLFAWSAVTTLWTARLIQKCLSHDNTIISFGDLAFTAYGSKARIAVTILVVIELAAASVGQIILFADGAQILTQSSNDIVWKVLCGVAFITLSCVPLRYLGTSSALSVFCFFIIAGIMVVVGLIRPTTPGSLRSLAHVSMFPKSWAAVPSSVGMISATWGGHTVFPELYQDMRKPERFFDSVKATYGISVPVYLIIGILGYLMFGNNMMGPITSEIMSLENVPRVIPIIIMSMVTFVPIAKVPLNILPLSTVLERAYNEYTFSTETAEKTSSEKPIMHTMVKPIIRATIGIFFVILAILFPRLDKVMAILGVIAGLLIAIILPICFYLSILKDQVSTRERYWCWVSVIFSGILTVVSLASTFVSVD